MSAPVFRPSLSVVLLPPRRHGRYVVGAKSAPLKTPCGYFSLRSLAPPLPNGPASLGSIWVPFSLCLVVLRGGLSRRRVPNTSPTEWVVLGGGDTRERTDFSPLGGKRGERTLGRRQSPSLTDSFAPFWSFRKGPAGGRSSIKTKENVRCGGGALVEPYSWPDP